MVGALPPLATSYFGLGTKGKGPEGPRKNLRIL